MRKHITAMLILAAVVFTAGRIAFYLSGETIWVTSVSKAVMTVIITMHTPSLWIRTVSAFISLPTG